MHLDLEIPDDLAGRLGAPGIDLSRRALEAFAGRHIPTMPLWPSSMPARKMPLLLRLNSTPICC
jgi:hypothetical protein